MTHLQLNSVNVTYDVIKWVIWLIYNYDMTHSYVWHDSFTYMTWLIYIYDMTHSHVWHDSSLIMWDVTKANVWHVLLASWLCAQAVWHDSFILVTWLIHMCDMTPSYEWHASFICVTWLIHISDVTHSYVWHDSFVCVLWPNHICNVTLSSVCRDWFIRVTWLIHICDMTHSHVWHDSSMCVTWLIHTCDMFHSHVRYHSSTRVNVCAVTNSYAGRDACTCVNKYVRTYMHAYSRIFKAHVCWQQTGPAHTECLRKKNDNFFLQKKSNQVCDLEYVWSYEYIMFHENASCFIRIHRRSYAESIILPCDMLRVWDNHDDMTHVWSVCIYLYIYIRTHTNMYIHILYYIGIYVHDITFEQHSPLYFPLL